MTLKDDCLSFSGVSSSDVISTRHPVQRLFSEGTVPGDNKSLFVFSAPTGHLQKKVQAQILNCMLNNECIHRTNIYQSKKKAQGLDSMIDFCVL